MWCCKLCFVASVAPHFVILRLHAPTRHGHGHATCGLGPLLILLHELLVSTGQVRQGQGLGSGDKKRRHSSAGPLSHGSVCVAAHHCVIRSGGTLEPIVQEANAAAAWPGPDARAANVVVGGRPMGRQRLI